MISYNQQVWTVINSLPVGQRFTAPELKQKGMVPSRKGSTLNASLTFLVKKGVVRKTAKWDGENPVTYEVVNTSIPQTRRNGLTPEARAKGQASLARINAARKEAALNGVGKITKTTIAVAPLKIIQEIQGGLYASLKLLDMLSNAQLGVAKGKSIKDFTSSELINELAGRSNGIKIK